ncbi:hypothetical protein N656DRAFT_718884 [Canariomyces notabilis]|uniref:Heterokaryon incompatibility domain-containing protein n=1 Tax=Canariomyces notabilis TaxID=2074819 RepID=A0AAN6T8M3_9PEZI|nr:hypothetical protein N656DRAFT_718884 [Canariomyces arenarius]
METRGDATSPLAKVARCQPGPIVARLLEIQESKEQHYKFLGYLNSLECLYLDETYERDPVHAWTHRTPLFRTSIDAFQEKDYLALSYTWEPSEFEDCTKGAYSVQTRNGQDFYPALVRNCVLDRAIAYMQHFGLGLLWIDRHCVKQRECKDRACDHEECEEKRDAVQAMDFVYRLSRQPVALLGRPISSEDELDLLAKILKGELVDENHETGEPQLSTGTGRSEANRALMLLNSMTSDRWWTRAWTFQESHCGGHQMTLLIRHFVGLERKKRSYDVFGQDPVFGDLRGELCVKYVAFSVQATRLCQAFSRIRFRTPKESLAIDHVLGAAGRYTLLLKRSEAMFPMIIDNVGRRNLSKSWDRLPIVANCCQYPIRLNEKELQENAYSVDLSIFALCLLNGEILHNGRAEELHASPSQRSVHTYLQTHFFNEFHGPRIDHNLTFNKSCRFINVTLDACGIMTEGHLWKLGEIVRTTDFTDRSPRSRKPRTSSAVHGQRRLNQLAYELRCLDHVHLADFIEKLDSSHSGRRQPRCSTFAKRYMRMEADRLVEAIENGETLRLGRLWAGQEASTPYSAIFIWEDGDDAREARPNQQQAPASFVFTASRPKEPNSSTVGTNDIDHHVSLEVTFAGLDDEHGIPRLYVRRWISGLCFFYGCLRESVMFPWPPSVETVIP